MPLLMYRASLGLGFCEYAEDKPEVNTAPDEDAWHIVGHTGDEPVEHPFSMGCTSPVLGGQ